jgi:hypothetical protein
VSNLSDDEKQALVARLRAVPLWEKTANLQAFAASLMAEDRCAKAVQQLAQVREHVETLIAEEPLTQLHRALVQTEQNLKNRNTES